MKRALDNGLFLKKRKKKHFSDTVIRFSIDNPHSSVPTRNILESGDVF